MKGPRSAAGIAAYLELECREVARLVKSHGSLAAAWQRWLSRNDRATRPTITVRTVEDGKR